MLHEVDASLRAFLTDALPGDTTVGFAPPTTQNPSEPPTAHLSLFLYDVHEDTSGRAAGWTEIRDDQHRVIDRRLALRRYQMSYLITASAPSPEEEHQLLGAVLTRMISHDALPQACVSAALAAAQHPVEIRIGHPSAVPPWQLWSALKAPPRACLDLVVTAPILPDRSLDIARRPDSLELGLTVGSPSRPIPQSTALAPVLPPGRRWTKVRITERLSSGSTPTPPTDQATHAADTLGEEEGTDG